jgi:hypothetical protein
MLSPIAFYKQQIDLAQQQIQRATTTFRMWIFIRLFIFSTVLVGVIVVWGNWKIMIPILVGGSLVFIAAISKFQDAKNALNKAKKWKELVHLEQLALDGNYCNFDNGEEYKDPNHPFAYDMDLFGQNSVFQFLNRTFSVKGKFYLSSLLKTGTRHQKYVNDMIVALSEQMEWCIQFRVNGATNDWNDAIDSDLEKLKTFTFTNPFWLNSVRYVLTILGVGSFVALTLGLLSGTAFTLVLLLNLFVVGYFLKTTNHAVSVVGEFESKVKFLMEQMTLVQTLNSSHDVLNEFKINLDKDKGALQALEQLLKIQKRFEMRTNVLVGTLLNGVLAWDLHQRILLKKWMNSNQVKIENWENDLVRLEAYISGAFLKFNEPETIFATFTANDELHVTDLRHPLIPRNKAVANQVQFDETHRLMILTGPNMAGKSTYLRAVGLLFVLANAGFPIYASKATIPHYALYSSMRTSDDLAHESSYFHAELTRLKFILDATAHGHKIFILLDEILKGTNSLDKEQGSKQFLQKLKRLNIQGIIATHDLALCELSAESNYFYNGYFDSTITNNELHFDYLWRAGVCKNMNASFLLKKMGLVD